MESRGVLAKAEIEGRFFFFFCVYIFNLGGWRFIGNLRRCLSRMTVGSYSSAETGDM